MRWMAVLGVVFAAFAGRPSRAAAEVYYADIDHDGIRDVVTVQTTPEPALKVWLSRTNTTLILPTKQQILAIAALDLTGDGRLQLVASDTSAKVHVWHESRSGGLRRTRPRRQSPAAGVSGSGQFDIPRDQSAGAIISDGSSALDDGRPLPAVGADWSIQASSLPDAPLNSKHVAPSKPRGPPLV
jgi:hypothetical protein